MSSSGENRIIQGTSFMYFDIKRMRAKDLVAYGQRVALVPAVGRGETGGFLRGSNGR